MKNKNFLKFLLLLSAYLPSSFANSFGGGVGGSIGGPIGGSVGSSSRSSTLDSLRDSFEGSFQSLESQGKRIDFYLDEGSLESLPRLEYNRALELKDKLEAADKPSQTTDLIKKMKEMGIVIESATQPCVICR